MNEANASSTPGAYVYAGFWMRVGATIIDTVIALIVTVPLIVSIYGWSYYGKSSTGLIAGPADFLITCVGPFLATIAFWMILRATPGKMAIGAQVVDARTGNALTFGQSVLRYLGYFVSTIPLGLGLIWVAVDARKQGWHDKIAGSVVIRRRGPLPVSFPDGGSGSAS